MPPSPSSSGMSEWFRTSAPFAIAPSQGSPSISTASFPWAGADRSAIGCVMRRPRCCSRAWPLPWFFPYTRSSASTSPWRFCPDGIPPSSRPTLSPAPFTRASPWCLLWPFRCASSITLKGWSQSVISTTWARSCWPPASSWPTAMAWKPSWPGTRLRTGKPSPSGIAPSAPWAGPIGC